MQTQPRLPAPCAHAPHASVALLEAVRAESAALAARGAALRAQVAALLPSGSRMLTTSYSSTLLAAVSEASAALSEAGGALGGVVVCEARPLCEGAAFAAALASAGVPSVTVITDAQAGLFVGAADLVLLGADALGPGGVVNKAGSRLLALAAREAGVPVYVCCDSGKVGIGSPVAALTGIGGGGGAAAHEGAPQGHGLAEEQEEKGVDEVVQGWPARLRVPGAGSVGAEAVGAAAGGGRSSSCGGGAAEGAAPAGHVAGGGEAVPAGAPALRGVEVRNIYFEAVPLKLLTGGVVTECGVMGQEDILAAVEDRRRRYLLGFDLATLEHPPPEAGGLGGSDGGAAAL
jgi:translation initiation factor 2B subunit (eIF-2B alpha/beta/delta family)